MASGDFLGHLDFSMDVFHPPPNLDRDSSALAPLTTRLATLQDAACRETLQASSRGQMIMSDASGYLGEGLG